MPYSNHKGFLELFQGSDVACTFGIPDPAARKGMRYVTEKVCADLIDVDRHFKGERSIVMIPLRGELCRWGAIDWDGQPGEAAPRLMPGFYRVPSKTAPGIHDFVFFKEWKQATQVRQFLRDASKLMGIPESEIFPKQNNARFGNGINLPFFGNEAGFEKFHPEQYVHDLPEVSDEEPEAQSTGEDDGYWDESALVAMLTKYQEINPGFEFWSCRDGLSVPCPGLTGWDDGAKHSQDGRVAHETIVFIRNSWPKFRCVHAHCDGECGSPKKTINDFRDFWDPFRLWEFEEWQESEIAKRGELFNVR